MSTSDTVQRILGTRYVCKLPEHATLTPELWRVILDNIHDPDVLQHLLNVMYGVDDE